MQFSTLLVAALASIVTAAPAPASEAGINERAIKYKGPCGEYTETRYINNKGQFPGYNLVGDIAGGGNCQQFDNPNGDKLFTFHVKHECLWCKFYWDSDCQNFDSEYRRPQGNAPFYEFKWRGAKSYKC